MGGMPWKDSPPTQIQVENMCREAAALALKLGWQPNDIKDLNDGVNRVLTHAEAAANRDFPEGLARLGTGIADSRAISIGLPHNNYGPSGWPDGWPTGTFERWDSFQVGQSDQKGSGGDKLRKMIREFMGTTNPSPLSQSSACQVFLKEEKIADGHLLADSRCYVRLLDLLRPFSIELGKVQGGSESFINLVSNRFAPKFLADSPLVLGFPAVDIYLNRPVDMHGIPVGDARNPVIPFLGGILIDNSTYVIVSDFCEELGISLIFDPSGPSIRLAL